MPEILTPAPEDAKHILTSKTFWANAIAVVATVVGWRFPAVGDFLRDNALLLGGALGTINMGLRTQTDTPVTLSVTKKF